MLHLVSFLALAVQLATADTSELRREELMTALRRGGYTVLLRHARTDRSFQEERSYVPKERSAQRNLTDDGLRVPTQAWVHRVRYVGVSGGNPTEALAGTQGLERAVTETAIAQ